jgi:hypothetical protein
MIRIENMYKFRACFDNMVIFIAQKNKDFKGGMRQNGDFFCLSTVVKKHLK